MSMNLPAVGLLALMLMTLSNVAYGQSIDDYARDAEGNLMWEAGWWCFEKPVKNTDDNKEIFDHAFEGMSMIGAIQYSRM